MKKRNSIVAFIILFLIFLIVFPFIKIDTGKKIYDFSYNMDISEYENNSCYDESYFYVPNRDISIYNFNFKKFLFFHVIVLEYEKGNVCDTEYLLEESYIDNFINNADIKDNSNNVDLKKLIEGRRAIALNKRYFSDDYSISIDYVLDGEYETMYIFYVDDLLVIQVGLSDEGPKFIAYK